ncbi:putative leucine-rich repeat-containing protein DDB_G0290503 [Aedes aegypti]|uniref:Uncharacterized protein n=1 Tax=Aedes aegypti TaxID=7159 RepID=A0A6I8U1V7_AEDAE|nr:putative leucine-rich repeat-containing protein DDB_G0290503 [Aedes aegypti]
MARNAVLARMETICAEVMEMPEIFLADDEEDDDEANDGGDDDAQSENLDADEPDDEDIPAGVDDEKGCGESDRKENDGSSGKSGRKNKGGKADPQQDKGVSVKVNCDDKKQQRYAKWISRALRAAVNPIVSRFNLNLKVNLDLNVANKANAPTKADPKRSNNESASQAGKPKPSPQQLQKRADLARIRELEKENRHLEKVFEKIVAAYTAMKTNLSEKTKEVEMHKSTAQSLEAQLKQITNEKEKLKTKSEQLLSVRNQLEKEKTQLQSQITTLQHELETLKKHNVSKCNDVQQLEKKLGDLQISHKEEMEKERSRCNSLLAEKQTIIDSNEEQLRKLKADIQELIDCKTATEKIFQQSVQEHIRSKNQLELRCVELMQQNRELNSLVSRAVPSSENYTVQEPISSTTSANITCPICGRPFKNLGDLQIHTENCGVLMSETFIQRVQQFVVKGKKYGGRNGGLQQRRAQSFVKP